MARSSGRAGRAKKAAHEELMLRMERKEAGTEYREVCKKSGYQRKKGIKSQARETHGDKEGLSLLFLR